MEWFLFAQVFFLLLPAAFANMAPVLFKAVPFLAYPVDGNKTFRGKRLFGENKTWRGFFFGVLIAIFITAIQSILIDHYAFFANLALIDYGNVALLGFLFGFGALAGDAIESFFKRQFDYKPGERLLFFDQADWVMGSFLCMSIIAGFDAKAFFYSVALFFVLHILVKRIGFLLRISEKPW